MFESPPSRAIALVVLVAALFGLLVWHGTLEPAPEQGAYPTQDEFLDDPDRYVGERVVTWGTVTGTDPVVIAVDRWGRPSTEVTVTGVDRAVSEGDGLSVFGRLTAERTVAALESFAIPPWGITYTYAVSFVAGVWVLVRIVRTWQVDRESVGLAPRTEPLELTASGGDDDA